MTNKAEKKREIYARIGVQLRNSRRAIRAERKVPGAMGLYLFAILDTRAEEHDGFVDEEVLLTAWGVDAETRERQLDALVSVDLLERVENGFRVVKYEEHNDTKADIESNRESARERMRSFRASVTANKRVTNAEQTVNTANKRVGNADVPISYSISISDLGRSDLPDSQDSARDPEPESFAPQGAPESREVPTPVQEPKRAPDPLPVPANGHPEVDLATPPAWWDGVCDSVEVNTGEKLRRAEAWIRYSGHRHGKRLAPNQRDAGYWLATVMVKEAREERHKATAERERERQRSRAGPVSPAESQFTPEEIREQVERVPFIRRKAKVPA